MREVGFEPGVFKIKCKSFHFRVVGLVRDLIFSLCFKNDVYCYSVKVEYANSSIVNGNTNTYLRFFP